MQRLIFKLPFGNQARILEESGDSWRFTILEDAWRDLVYAMRRLRQSPGFTLTVVLTLALGIGANTAIFSLVHTLILRDLPVRNPDQLVELLSLLPGDPPNNSFGWEYYEYIREQSTVFSDLTGVARAVGRDPGATRYAGVTGNFFPVLGLRPAIGRLIAPEDTQPGTAPVAVLSWSFWGSEFAFDPEITGERIVVDGVPATIVGVAPRGFFGLQEGARTDLWIPFDGESNLALLGRLAPGVSLEEAQVEMTLLDQWRIERITQSSSNPLWQEAKIGVESASAGFSQLRYEYQRPLLVLMAIVALLLTLACANVAGLLLARAAARNREMAVRVSQGAGRFRLVRQVLTESVLLSVAGAIPGICLGYLGADALVRIFESGRPLVGFGTIEIAVRPDLQVLLFTAGVVLLTGLLFGLAPAARAFTSVPAPSLKETAKAGPSRRLLGQSLVVVQVALSVVLLGAAGLFAMDLWNLRNVGLGFQPDSVLIVGLTPERSQRNQLFRPYQELLGRLEELPAVSSVTLSSGTPTSAGAALRFANVDGFEESAEDRRYLWLRWVAPNYFETLASPMLSGRDFQLQDAGGPRVAVISQATARYYFGENSPIGRRFTFDGDAEPYEIVGVVVDSKYNELREPAPRTIYLNAFQEPVMYAHSVVLRTEVPPLTLADSVRQTAGNVVPEAPVGSLTTLSRQMDASIVPERVLAALSGLFGGLGTLLAAISLYGLLTYTVTRRTSEIGIRMALGATRAGIMGMVLNRALRSVLAGIGVGTLASIWSNRLATSLIEGLPEENLVPVILAGILLTVVVAVAACIPAHRAARMAPAVALRHE